MIEEKDVKWLGFKCNILESNVDVNYMTQHIGFCDHLRTAIKINIMI
jgi:hypothetical protein